jgi:hypothetical protein
MTRRRSTSTDRSGSPDPSSRFRADGFTIAAPEGWRSETVYQLAGPGDDGARLTLQVHVDPDVTESTAADYADTQIQEQKASMGRGTVLDEWSVRLENDVSGYRILFRWTRAPGRMVRQHQLYVVHAGCGFRMCVTGPEKRVRRARSQIEEMIRGFEPARPLCLRRPN